MIHCLDASLYMHVPCSNRTNSITMRHFSCRDVLVTIPKPYSVILTLFGYGSIVAYIQNDRHCYLVCIYNLPELFYIAQHFCHCAYFSLYIIRLKCAIYLHFSKKKKQNLTQYKINTQEKKDICIKMKELIYLSIRNYSIQNVVWCCGCVYLVFEFT